MQVKCPFCAKDDTRVVDSRPSDGNTVIKRRRICDACKKRFTTFEKVEMMPLIIVKKDQSREPYDRHKIEKGILRSCHKRPISADQINKMVDEIETQLFNQEDREITSSVVGEILMEHLRKLDMVAYIRFASIYREYKDVNTFVEEIKALTPEIETAKEGENK